MQGERTVGNRGLLCKDIEKYENPFGKPKYIVVKPGFQSIILGPDEMQDFEEIKNEQNQARGFNPQDRHFFKPKKPANLTKKLKRQQEQKEKKKDNPPRTQIISVDVVPSTINQSEINENECHDCRFLKIDNISLKQQAKIYKDEKIKMQRQYQDLLRKHKASLQKIKEYEDEKIELSDRLQSLSSLYESRKQRRKTKPSQIKPQQVSKKLIDQIINQSQLFLQRTLSLQRQNEQLRKQNEAKSSQIKEYLAKSRMSSLSQEFVINSSSINQQ